MSQLASHSIREFCDPEYAGPTRQGWCPHPKTGDLLPMISPFVGEKTIVNGKSYGLSHASYDLRISHDLILGPSPGEIMKLALGGEPAGNIHVAMRKLWSLLRGTPPAFAIAHTIEDVAIPHRVCAYIKDKSTYARLGMSAFNTLFDPGFVGNCTLELVNFSDEPIVIKSGDPICQMVFYWLDEPAKPYDGKYQLQPKRAIPAILEGVANA